MLCIFVLPAQFWLWMYIKIFTDFIISVIREIKKKKETKEKKRFLDPNDHDLPLLLVLILPLTG